MINPNINGNRHQLIMMQPKNLIVDGGGGSGKVEGPTTPKVDTTQQAIEGFNNGTKTIDELKAALNSSGTKYEDDGSTLKFKYNNKQYSITYQTETTKEKSLEQTKKDMGLRDTFYKGVYCEANKPGGSQKHYFWDEGNKKMVEIPNVFYVSSDGHEVKNFIQQYLASANDTKAEDKTTETTVKNDNANTATTTKKWSGDVDQKLKDLEAKYNSLQSTIKKNGGQVSAEMQKQLNEIKSLMNQIKTEDDKNIDMGKLDLDLNSITGYSNNTKNVIKKDISAGKEEVKGILNNLKDKMYNQLLTQAKSLGMPENEFKTIFDKTFTSSVNWTINNKVDVNDYIGKALDNVKYKVKDVVDGFINKMGTVLKAEIEAWKDKNPSDSIQNKFEQLENTVDTVNKELTSDTNAKVTIDKNALNLNNITGYKTNTKNVVKKDINGGKEEVKGILNGLKDQIYNQALSQAKALGIPENDFKTIFDNTYSSTMDWTIKNKVDVTDLWGKGLDKVTYKVKDVVDGFITKLDANLDPELVKYQLKH